MPKIHVIIPARFNSTRLPGKLMLDLAGEPVIAHVVRLAQKVVSSVYVATDHKAIFDCVTALGAKAIMTSTEHNSGTDRLAEVADKLCFSDDDIVINLQGDEPLMPTQLIKQVSDLLVGDSVAGMATLMQPISNFSDFVNPNVVKVIKDENNHAVYFSRAPIPYPRDNFDLSEDTMPKGDFNRHIGLYAYRVKVLKAITCLPEHPLEQLEKLEQLRPLANGVKIVMDVAMESPEHEIDTIEDLELARIALQATN